MSPSLCRSLRLPALLAGLACAAAASWAQAGTVEVHFPAATQMSDVRDSRGGSVDVATPLTAYLQTLGEKTLGDRRLVIDVIDVDLAGQLEPVGPRQEMIRVMRSHTWPRIELRYTLSDASGTGLRSGEVKLVDTDYLSNSSLLGSTDPWRYEKQLLRNWFQREFPAD